jgi:hypothetical protein
MRRTGKTRMMNVSAPAGLSDRRANNHFEPGGGVSGLTRTSNSVPVRISARRKTISRGATVQAISMGLLPETCGGSLPPRRGSLATYDTVKQRAFDDQENRHGDHQHQDQKRTDRLRRR